MIVIYIALPIAIGLGGLALIACIACIRGGQFDDLDSASVRMLIDDSPASPNGKDSDIDTVGQ